MATLPGQNGRIVFSAYGELFTIQPDGSGLAQVRRPFEDDKSDWGPSWSPDGTRIATSGRVLEPPDDDGLRFWSDHDLELFGSDGSGFIRLTTPNQHYSGSPAWSPDGTRIAYQSDQWGDASIYAVRADGTDARIVVEGMQHAEAFDPAWSPDGNWIVFAREVDEYGSTDLFLVRPDGSDLHRLLERPGQEFGPSWSPDGNRIVFAGTDPRVDNGPAGWSYPGASIHAVSATGGRSTRLTTAEHDATPVWSPDGTQIVFQRDPTMAPGPDNTRVWLMNADGTNPHALTDRCLQCDPDWQRVPPFGDRPSAQPPTATAPPVVTPPATTSPAVTTVVQIRGLTLSRKRFSWRQRRAVSIRVRVSAPAVVRFVITRRGSTRALGTTVRGLPAGISRFRLVKALPRRLKPGRYTLTVKALHGSSKPRTGFRVLVPR